ncbi:MAG: cytochrome c biogenesis protein CcsA [Coriobacteriales bacterium]|jgi:cytochrome c-type biogenesis protein CcmF|nr:cytochrome c biogenesis protein CcsA [Coriobacteriales bacterium]
MTIAVIGSAGLALALLACIISIIALSVGSLTNKSDQKPKTASSTTPTGSSYFQNIAWLGHIALIISAVALTACCLILVFCFMSGDNSILYVIQNRAITDSSLQWLYLLSGLWGGRSGSLLFWAWLIVLFNLSVAIRNIRNLNRLDNVALAVSQLVLAAFLGVLVFSAANQPFTATPGIYLDEQGQLTGQALTWGMNKLLEHWAMVLHPPTLFIGYAGLTVPFAYALAAVIVNDDSRQWVDKSVRYALASWLFLGAGIGLGAIWAYVVLGWGGYWGWDPVENASLLSWLLAVALVHSFTVYRQRGAYKRWSVMSACLAFAFVIVGTFITRSGIIDSVHAFESDPVSLALFGFLILVSVLAGAVGLLWRRKSFASTTTDEADEMLTKDTAYFFNNVAMVIVAVLITYLTMAPALPGFMPFAGQSLSSISYNAIARPMGILYCLVMAVCPLLVWGRVDRASFIRKAKLPAACAAVLFGLLMVYFIAYLAPAYEYALANNIANLDGYIDAGPRWYYYLLTIIGFLVASLLFFNSLFLLGRATGAYSRSRSVNALLSFGQMLRRQPAMMGGFLSHLGIAVILVGLIGSSMYVTEAVGYIAYDMETDTASNDLVIKGYILKYQSNDIVLSAGGNATVYSVNFAVFKNGKLIGEVHPSIELTAMTQQRKYNAATLSFIGEDLFVVYHGVSTHGAFSLDVRVNPLINLVWLGFVVLMAGTTVAAVGQRRPKVRKADETVEEATAETTTAQPIDTTEIINEEEKDSEPVAEVAIDEAKAK